MQTQHPDLEKPIRQLACCCCGETTYGRQHWNRDAGYGLCVPCVPFVSRGETAESMARTYGVAGVHYAVGR